MNYCPNCGTQLNGRFCSNCGYDTQQAGEPVSQNIVKESKPNILTKCKDWVKKAWDWVKNNKKLSILISSSAVVLLTLVIVLSTTLSNIFRVGKVNNIELGMTKEEVTDILGKPTEISENERVYCWYEKKAAKKIEKVVGSFDDLLDFDEDISEEDFEKEFEESFEEADGAYSKLEKLTFKAIIVEFSSDKVTSVFLDKNHKYVEEEYYVSKEEKEVKKTEYDVENEEITFITTVNENGEEIASSNEVPSFEYTTKFKDGSYMLATANPTVEDGQLKWKDNVTTYFAKDLKYSRMKITETGKLVSWQGNVLFFEIPNTVTSIASGAFTDCYTLISLTIPESVTGIGEIYKNCPRLVEIYNKSSVDYTSRNINVYTPISGGSRLKIDRKGFVFFHYGKKETYSVLNEMFSGKKELVGYTGTKKRVSTPLFGRYDINEYAFYGNEYVETVRVRDVFSSLLWSLLLPVVLVLFIFDETDFTDINVNLYGVEVKMGVFTFCILLYSILVSIITFRYVKRWLRKRKMRKLYRNIRENPNKEITLADGSTKTVAGYLQERESLFKEYFKTQCKRKKKALWMVTLFLIIGWIMPIFDNVFSMQSDIVLIFMIAFWLFFGIVFPIIYLPIYRARKRKAEKKLYDNHLKVLENYYTEKCKNKDKKKITLEKMLASVGLTWSKKELKAKN